MGKSLKRRKKIQRWRAHTNRSRKGKTAYSFAKRQIKGKEQKQRAKVAKLEKKQFKKEVNFQYQKFWRKTRRCRKSIAEAVTETAHQTGIHQGEEESGGRKDSGAGV